MRQGARLILHAGMTAALLAGASLRAEAQFLVVGDDNKLHWDDAGKPVFTEPGKLHKPPTQCCLARVFRHCELPHRKERLQDRTGIARSC